MDEISSYRLFDDELILTSGTDQYEAGPSTQVRMKLDYIKPTPKEALYAVMAAKKRPEIIVF